MISVVAICCGLCLLLLTLGVRTLLKGKELPKEKAFLKKRGFFNVANNLKGKFYFDEYLTHVKKCVNYNAVNKLNLNININLLKQAGIFKNKPFYKETFTCFENAEKLKIKTIKKLSNNFTFIACVKGETDQKKVQKFLNEINYQNAHVINLESVNFKILFEVNKLNINYVGEQKDVKEGTFINNDKLNNLKYKDYCYSFNNDYSDVKVVYHQFMFPNHNENIFNYTSFNNVDHFKISAEKNKKINVKKIIKLENEFFKTQKIKNKLAIKFINGEIKYYIFNNNFNFFIKKSKKNVFLILIFEIYLKKGQSNELLCIYAVDENIKLNAPLKTLKLNNYMLWRKFFNVKFDFENKKLKHVLNEQLPNLLVKNLIDKKQSIVLEANNFKELLSFKKQNVNYEYIVKNCFGIKLNNNILSVEPKKGFIKEFKFSIIVDNTIYNVTYVSADKKSIIYSNTSYVNLSSFNLKNLLNNNIKFCG